jgi:3-deoxy-manno-octulosonate cytidylyltransferase (CMP-KDO synthetase)
MTVVVPFRLNSSRFPNKALANYKGQSLLTHAVRNARALSPIRVVVTGPREDLAVVQSRNVDLDGVHLMPSPGSCGSATERVVSLRNAFETPFVLSLPVDEPEVRPDELRKAVDASQGLDGADVLTFWCPFFSDDDYRSPLSAKIITDPNGRILYMSRAGIPVTKAGEGIADNAKKNVGAFLFPKTVLDRLSALDETPTALDKYEGLEQLRWLELGFAVKTVQINHIGFGVDVPEQLVLLERRCGR